MSRRNQSRPFDHTMATRQGDCIQGVGSREAMVTNQNSIFLQKQHQIASKSDNLKVSQGKPLFLGVQAQNSIESDSKHQEWTIEEENLLLELHNQKGNKWVEIARELHKNDNSVKNHYHSKLRKIIRKINKCVEVHLAGQSKPLKNSIISTIVQTAQDIYGQKEGDVKSQARKAYELKNRLLNLAELVQQQVGEREVNEIKNLISQIQEFTRTVKGKTRSTPSPKPNSNKYKGKEIIGLLHENNKKNTEKQESLNSRRSLDSISSEEQREEAQIIPKKTDKRVSEDITNVSYPNSSQNPSSPTGYPAFFYFHDHMLPFQHMLYPMYHHQSSLMFSGRNSSFTSYVVQKQCGQLPTTCTSMNRIEVDSRQIQSESDLSRHFQKKQSLQ